MTKKKIENPYAELERIFHEPNRLAIMSALVGSSEPLSFSEIKKICELTDGNLSRHLKALEKAGAVKIKKEFVGAKPKTTATLTKKGRKSFLEYLSALEQVLKATEKRIKNSSKKKSSALDKINNFQGDISWI